MRNANIHFVIWNVAASLATQLLSQEMDFSLKLLDPRVLLIMTTHDKVTQSLADVSVNYGQVPDPCSTKTLHNSKYRISLGQ
jgi:hypothetical protein